MSVRLCCYKKNLWQEVFSAPDSFVQLTPQTFPHGHNFTFRGTFLACKAIFDAELTKESKFGLKFDK